MTSLSDMNNTYIYFYLYGLSVDLTHVYIRLHGEIDTNIVYVFLASWLQILLIYNSFTYLQNSSFQLKGGEQSL